MQEIKTLSSVQAKQINAVIIWLYTCCAFVFCMIIVGAITRLTESGLSIVEWKPLIGAIPPLNEEEWQKTFDLYKETPEFQKKNFWMGLSDFKSIFFWEWFHRLLGRLIGVVYALPFLFFLIKGWIPSGFKLKLFGVFLLGGAQGFMGWYMVKSGLVDMPAVSHFRLAAHLSLAFVIYSSMLWLALSLKRIIKGNDSNKIPKPLIIHGWLSLAFLTLTIIWGAFTAGLDAGLIYNDTFPKMGKTWLPEEIWFYQPLWKNFIENHAGVQFTHRWLAILTFLVVFLFSLHAMKCNQTHWIFAAIGFFVFIQLGLGILTLITGVSLPIAVMHQGGAVILLSLLLMGLHKISAQLKN